MVEFAKLAEKSAARILLTTMLATKGSCWAEVTTVLPMVAACTLGTNTAQPTEQNSAIDTARCTVVKRRDR